MAKRRIPERSAELQINTVNQAKEAKVEAVEVQPGYGVVGSVISVFISNVGDKVSISPTGDGAIYCLKLKLPSTFDTDALNTFNNIDWKNLREPNDHIKFIRSFLAKYLTAITFVSITAIN